MSHGSLKMCIRDSRNGDDIARFGNQSDCLHDGERIVVVSDILNEGLIDLDLVEWKAV